MKRLILTAAVVAAMGCGSNDSQQGQAAKELDEVRDQLRPMVESVTEDYRKIEQRQKRRAEGPWTRLGEGETLNDVTITIIAANLGRVPLFDRYEKEDALSEEALLAITIEIANTSTTRKRKYHSWSSDCAMPLDINPYLADDLGNEYTPVNFELGLSIKGGQTEASIYPGQCLQDVVVFERPVAGARRLVFAYPASSFGGKGEAVFCFPFDRISRR